MWFVGRHKGPVSNFLLSPLPSEISDLLARISTLGTRKSPQGPNLEVGRLGDNSCLMLCQKFMDKEWRVSRRSTNFAATWRIFRFLVKIRSHKTLQIATSAATLQTVRWRFWQMTASTCSTWSSSTDVEGSPDLGSSSMDILPDLKCWYYLWHCIQLKQASP